jgi:sec-independent protein translocase protein TatA
MNEWIWVAIAALVIFGGSQLPKIARNFGRAQGELKKGLAEGAKQAAEADEIRATTKNAVQDAVNKDV